MYLSNPSFTSFLCVLLFTRGGVSYFPRRSWKGFGEIHLDILHNVWDMSYVKLYEVPQSKNSKTKSIFILSKLPGAKSTNLKFKLFKQLWDSWKYTKWSGKGLTSNCEWIHGDIIKVHFAHNKLISWHFKGYIKKNAFFSKMKFTIMWHIILVWYIRIALVLNHANI